MEKVSGSGRKQVVAEMPKATKGGAKKIDADKVVKYGKKPAKLRPQPLRDEAVFSRKAKINDNKKPVRRRGAIKPAVEDAVEKGDVAQKGVRILNLPPVKSFKVEFPPTSEKGGSVGHTAPDSVGIFEQKPFDAKAQVPRPKKGGENGIMNNPAPPKHAPEHSRIDLNALRDRCVPPAGLDPKDPLYNDKIAAAFKGPVADLEKLEERLKTRTFAQVATDEVDRVSAAAKKLVMVVDGSTTLQSVARTLQSVVAEGRGLVRAIVGVNKATTNAGTNLAKGAIRALFRG